MILSDRDIKKAIKEGHVKVEPLMSNSIQPASVDLHLDSKFLFFKYGKHTFIDVKEPADDLMEMVDMKEDGYVVIHPNEFVLGNTLERVTVDKTMAGRLEGKSSLARLGLLVHVTGGYLDPGNSTTLTLEFHNVNNLPIKLYPGMKIAQMSFMPMSSECEHGYGDKKLGSKYYGKNKPVASQIYKDFLKK